MVTRARPQANKQAEKHRCCGFTDAPECHKSHADGQRAEKHRCSDSNDLTLPADLELMLMDSELRSIAEKLRVAHALRAGHFSCLRALAQAILVAAIFLTKSSSRAAAISSGGPPSMSSLLGSPWLSKFLKRLGLLRLT